MRVLLPDERRAGERARGHVREHEAAARHARERDVRAARDVVAADAQPRPVILSKRECRKLCRKIGSRRRGRRVALQPLLAHREHAAEVVEADFSVSVGVRRLDEDGEVLVGDLAVPEVLEDGAQRLVIDEAGALRVVDLASGRTR